MVYIVCERKRLRFYPIILSPNIGLVNLNSENSGNTELRSRIVGITNTYDNNKDIRLCGENRTVSHAVTPYPGIGSVYAVCGT